MKIKFVKGKNYHIPFDEDVKVTKFKNGTAQITHIKTKNNNLSRYRRKGNEIINTETGEIKEILIPKFKTDKTIRRTIKETIRPLLENNFKGGKNELFVTLTFEEEMNDFDELPGFFNNFWNRLCYRYKNLDLSCLYVKEMQENRHSWHYHLIIKEENDKYLYIPNDTMREIWREGFTKTSRITTNSKYLSVEIDEETAMLNTLKIPSERFHIDKVIDYMCKLRTKSGAIPSSGRIHGKKGNLKLPEIKRMSYKEANETILKDATLIGEDTQLLKNADNDCIINYIHNEKWKLNNDVDDLDGDDTS